MVNPSGVYPSLAALHKKFARATPSLAALASPPHEASRGGDYGTPRERRIPSLGGLHKSRPERPSRRLRSSLPLVRGRRERSERGGHSAPTLTGKWRNFRA